MMDLIPSKLNGLNLENMSGEEMAVLQEKLTNLRIQNLEKTIKFMADKVEKIEEKQERGLEVAVNSMRVKEPKYGYVSQGDFGRFFDVPMSSVRVGKLFKVVGLAKKHSGTTIPYFELIPKYAQITTRENFSETKWNYSECVKKVDSWLTKNDLFESFYSCKTKAEREKFIDSIFEKFIN